MWKRRVMGQVQGRLLKQITGHMSRVAPNCRIASSPSITSGREGATGHALVLTPGLCLPVSCCAGCRNNNIVKV